VVLSTSGPAQAPGNPLLPLLLRWNDLGGYPCRAAWRSLFVRTPESFCDVLWSRLLSEYADGRARLPRRNLGGDEKTGRCQRTTPLGGTVGQLATSERAAIRRPRGWTSPALRQSCTEHGPRTSEASQLPRSAAGTSRRCSKYSAVQKDHANFVPEFGCASVPYQSHAGGWFQHWAWDLGRPRPARCVRR
jgi:hypothetical protein